MKQQKRLNDSAAMRWGALAVVSFTMMAAYFVNDVVAPLKSMLEATLSWSSTEYGLYAGAYSFLNVFLLMLLWGGLILDRLLADSNDFVQRGIFKSNKCGHDFCRTCHSKRRF